jgi:thymidine kinase
MNKNEQVGYLELFIGPMFAGKTSKLLELYNMFVNSNIYVKAINYVDDNRYSDEDVISSHNKETIPCIKCKNLNDIYPIINISEKNITDTDFMLIRVFLINEGQFYGDIIEWIKVAVSPPYNKIIYICGLDGDFMRKPFGNWLDIIPLCDKISKLYSICECCRKNNAIFTQRLSSETERIVIGTNNYIPLCRKCYNERLIV